MTAKYTPEQCISAFWAKVAVNPDDESCWLWKNSKDRNGYGHFKLGGRTQYSHRVAWQLANGNIPEGLDVCHSCDTPSCCNPKHLFLGTHQDNMDDMANKGRQRGLRGERNSQHKLTLEQVKQIRERYSAGGVLQRELAAEFGVSQPMIGYIVRREFWAESVD